MNSLPGSVEWSSWKDEFLPRNLWACLLVGAKKREDYLSAFREIALLVPKCIEETQIRPLQHEYLATLSQEQFDEIFSPLFQDLSLRGVFSILATIETLPDNHRWKGLFGNSYDEETASEYLTIGVAKTLYHQSEEATDVRWFKLFVMLTSGKLHFAPHMRDRELQILEYPNRGDMKHVRPSIRAGEMAFRRAPKEVSGKLSDDEIVFDHEGFWAEMFQRTDCIAIPKTDAQPPVFTSSELECELNDLFEELVLNFFQNTKTTTVDSKVDGAFGICLYSVRLLLELSAGNAHNMAIGRMVLRSIVELSITLAYLRKQSDQVLWDQYRAHGAGQSALAYLKLLDSESLPEYVDIDNLEELANEDGWFETKDIKVGAWSNVNLRKMAETAKVKDRYDKYYDWTSGYLHGQWSVVQDAMFTSCGHPLHRYHRIPLPTHRLPSVTSDCLALVNIMLDDLSAMYPKISTRLRVHKKS